MFFYDVISVTRRVIRRHSSNEGFVDSTWDYKYRLPLLGSVTSDLTTSKNTSMLILSLKVYYICNVWYVGDEMNVYYIVFCPNIITVVVVLLITLYVPTYLIEMQVG